MKKRQLAMVIDLNKCIGCHTCTLACKTMWTDRNGREYMYWNHVETQPSEGYPKKWQDMGGGFDENGELKEGRMPKLNEYGIPWEYNYEDLIDAERLKPSDKLNWGVNWEEDKGSGDFPFENYFFYIPRLCNHCDNPACISACDNDAIFKRKEDGIVLIDLDKCDGSRFCISACPYKKIYFNPAISKSEKCNFCFPLIEKGLPPACSSQCVGRARWVGFLNDETSRVYKLVNIYKVALPLRGDFNTGANVYYIPPMDTPVRYDENGKVSENSVRVSMEYLERLFGVEVYDAIDLLRSHRDLKRSGKESELMDILISYNFEDMFEMEKSL